MTYDEKVLEQKLDSILREGELLYKYERAAWSSTDYANSNEFVKKYYSGYFVYQDGKKIKGIIFDENTEDCVAEYVFGKNFDAPEEVIVDRRRLTQEEKKLIKTRTAILQQLSDPKYKLTVPDGFSLNIILIPGDVQYKLYIITGTSRSDVIPFGNDYLFVANENGEIEEWSKFHSRLIPIETVGPNGETVIMPVHSHLKTTPLVTATDICTFRLYAPFHNMQEFMVYSTAMGKYLKYNLKKNKITITDK
ncbi:hypothetical protein D0T57_10480 [Dysgonomonas sp. 511]|nr:hypothetical protein [Dysgonomonas sp. 511]